MSVLAIESALKVSAILAAALIAGVLLNRRSAALRHWVLGVAVICAWASPLLSGVLPSWPGAVLWNPNPSIDSRTASAFERVSASDSTTGQETATQVAFSLPVVPGASPVDLHAADVARGAWFAGSVMSMLILFVGLGRLRRLASRARTIESGPWCELGEEVRAAYGLSSPVRLLQSDHPSLLITWGWRRPTVLLPAAAPAWSRDRMRIVLSHEFAHIARGDWAVQLAAHALRALYWFNPLLWIACRRLRIDSERACDDDVLARGIERADYAGHLIALARSLHSRQPWLPAPAMARSSTFEGRIRAMLNTTLNRRPMSLTARAATTAALLALTVAVAGLRAQTQFFALSGTVLDPTNRVLPDARLVLTNPATRAKYEVRTDATGRYQFVGLPPAAYTLEVNLPGFQPLKEAVAIQADLQRELQLKVGTLEESITVTNRPKTVPPPDASTIQRREQARRAAIETLQRAKAKCASGAGPANVGGNILAPRKLVDMRPVYPDYLKEQGIGGTVTMDAVIGIDGTVRTVRNINGPHPDLEAAAADAVRQWQFSTTLLNCEPIEVEMHVTTNFTIEP